MRISQAHTGNKLDTKTFDQLEEGDLIYWACSVDRKVENAIWTVKKVMGKIGYDKDLLYTDKNPDKPEMISCDILLTIKNKTNIGSYERAVPSGCTYYARKYAACATSLELLLEVIKKYNITKLSE